MSTKRTRRARGRRAEIPADLCDYLADKKPGWAGVYFLSDLELRAAWGQCRDQILQDWINENPGIRPLYWWRYEAPEPRRRISGVGQAAHEVSAYVENYKFGLPDHWVRRADWLRGVVVDPSDPPTFESEATYLDRHDLLLPGEREHLGPDDFAPEVIEVETDPEEAETPPEAA